MKLIVTGAGGLVGRAVTAHCRSIGDTVVALEHKDLDISDESKVRAAFRSEKPDGLINCAAYTDVDGAETEKDLCYRVNRDGVRNLAAACDRSDAGFVTISTDYVFDGQKDGFYTEQDLARPLSVYGKAKLEGEIAAREEYEKSVVVRTGWIFGSPGTNFLSVLKDLLMDGNTVTAITDSFGTPTYAVDLAVRLRELLVLEEPGLFHAANSGDGTSYAGFALETARLLNLDDGFVKTVLSSSLNRAAPRPVNSRLGCLNAAGLGLAPLPDWKDALKRHVE